MIIGLDSSRVIKTKKTGVEWYSYYLIKELIKIDNYNNYLLYTPSTFKKLYNLPKNFEEKLLIWPLKKYWSILRLSWEMIINKPDLLFIPSHNFPLIMAKKNIITWHDLAYEHYPEYYSKKELISLKSGAKRMIKNATKILTVSDFTKRELIKFYKIPENKIEVIYLGYDPGVYNLKNINIDCESNQSIKKPYILHIGRIELKKNLINLIKAYNLLRNKYKQNYQLVMIGPLGYKNEKILNEILNSNYKNDIQQIGWVGQQDKLKILAGADISVCPSFYEGFGLPLIESMAMETPVVASNIEAHAEIADNAACYFSPNNFEEMASAIYKVLKNENIRNKLIENGKDRIKNFTWEKTGLKTLSLIKNL